MRSLRTHQRAIAATLISIGCGFVFLPTAFADDDPPPAPGVQVDAVPMSDTAQPAAVTACGAFGEALDGSSTYYGEFADALEGTSYTDPGVQSTNEVGRTALRQAAGVALDAAGTPELDPSIANPMRSWSMASTRLLVKMGLRIPGDSLNNTATDMNTYATQAQEACAAAGTHA